MHKWIDRSCREIDSLLLFAVCDAQFQGSVYPIEGRQDLVSASSDCRVPRRGGSCLKASEFMHASLESESSES